MNYPERGKMSDDGKLYTHTDGTVHALTIAPAEGWRMCVNCSFVKHGCDNGRVAPCTEVSIFKRIEGAYVPSTEEREACDVMREGIRNCANAWLKETPCLACKLLADKTCALRAYLAAKGCKDAWEVKP